MYGAVFCQDLAIERNLTTMAYGDLEASHQKIMNRQLKLGSWKEHLHMKVIRRARTGREREKRLRERCKRREEEEKQQRQKEKMADRLDIQVLKAELSPEKEQEVRFVKKTISEQKAGLFEKVQQAFELSQRIQDSQSRSEGAGSQETVKKQTGPEMYLDIIFLQKLKENICKKVSDSLKDLEDRASNGRINEVSDVLKTMRTLIEEVKAFKQPEED